MKVAGLLENKMDDALAEKFAAEYVRIHNQACKEYKLAFKKVGAKMWHGDGAHELKKDNQTHIVGLLVRGTPLSQYSIVRPLTVLNSFPNVTEPQRNQLNIEIDKIFKKYTKELNDFKKQF